MKNHDEFNDLARYLRTNDDAWDTDTAWTRLQARMHGRRPNRKPWLIAALLIVALGLGLMVRAYFSGTTDEVQHAAIQRYVTGAGERLAFQLEDGTTVELAPRSQLDVHRFDGQSRNVALQGRAFFTVARDVNRPFSVRAQNTEVRVLGTSFDVNAFSGAPVQVAVATGQVQVNSTLVTPGQLAIVQANRVNITSVNVLEVTAWRSGQLIFTNTRFADVIATLERWHDVDIEIDPVLAESRISAVFAQQSADEVFQLLAATLDARVTRAGRRVTFQPK